MNVYRPLRHVLGSPWLVGLCAAALVALALTARPPTPTAPPHRVGFGFLLALLTVDTVLASFAAWFLDREVWMVAVAWVSLPLSALSLGMGFAWVGRLHRLLGSRRFAQVSDLAGVAIPMVWVGSQWTVGYPTAVLGVPGGLALALGALVLGTLPVSAVRAYQSRSSLPAGPS
jgi:hypothetical protein